MKVAAALLGLVLGALGCAADAPIAPPAVEPTLTPEASWTWERADGPLGPGFRDASDAWGLPAGCWVDEPPPDATVRDRQDGGGGVLADFDGDGDLDAVLASLYCPAWVLRNDGGRFESVEAPALQALRFVTAFGLVDAGYDGRPDLLVGAQGSLWLLRNQGGLAFGEPELLVEGGPNRRVESVASADVDGDGHVDLAVGMAPIEAIDGWQEDSEDVLLWGSEDGWVDGSDAWREPPDRSGITYLLGWVDADQDGDLDAYAVRDRGALLTPNKLFLNPGNREDPWLEVFQEAGLDLVVDGMGLAAGDVDGDGSLEVAVTDLKSRLHLRTIDGGWPAVDVGAARGLQAWAPQEQVIPWGVEFVDVDRDGDRDALIAYSGIEFADDTVPQVALWELVDGVYRPRPTWVPDLPDRLDDRWRSPLIGDVDGDGSLDALITVHEGRPRLLLGSPPEHGWLDVELRGRGFNPLGLGARVELRTSVGEQWATLAPGSSGVFSAGPLRLHFGLGDAEPEGLTVHWPDGLTTVHSVPGRDRVVLLER